MRTWPRISIPAAVVLAVAVVVSACGGGDPTPTPAAAPISFSGVPGIVDPSNFGWPREIEGLNGRVTIEAKPQRIVTLSVGHDEMTLGLVPKERLIATSANTKNPAFSNIADLVRDTADVSREPEVILSANPDIMVTSGFIKADVVQALTNAGLTVVQTDLDNTTEGRLRNVLLLGYIYGEEDRAVDLAREISDRFQALTVLTQAQPREQRPRVLAITRFSEKLYAAGRNATEGLIIEAAGGLNVAAEAGLDRNEVVSLESVLAMGPEVIVIPQPRDFGAEEFRQDLLNEPALASVPAVRDGNVFVVNNTHFTTLSYWNLVGVEELGRMLWPEAFEGKEFPPFSLPG